MNAAQILRDVAARQAALRDLALQFDRHCENEQIARLSGDTKAEFEEHDAALIAYKAWEAEMNDPEGV